MATIKIMLACAYCYSSVSWSQSAIELRSANGKPLREQQIATVKCPHCDSTFAVDVGTRRKSKGKRLKAAEAKLAAELAAKVEAANTENERIAKELLADPRCECAKIREAKRARGEWGYHDDRPDGLQTGGSANGIPLPPRHRYQCPANPDRIREAKEAS